MASGLAEWLASDHSTGHTSSSSSSRFSSTEDVNEDFPDDHSEEEASSRIGYGRQRPRQSRNEETDRLWYPWHDKETCVLDILRHLPRSIFSDKQMEVILWSMAILGVDDVPSVSVMKEINATLQVLCGVDTIRYEGKLGHVYYANDLASIIAQEMSNPHVRPFLQHYPEDAGNELSECWQAQRWLREIDPSLVTPMAHIGHQDFYVFEPAMLRDGSVVVPERWFTRKQGRTQNLYARAFRTSTVISDSGNSGYIVNEFDVIEVSSRDLWLSFPQLIQTFHSDGLPDPRNIIGIMKAIGRGICPWTYTTPDEGNRWRKLAKGHRVVSFMMWLYCDDTSGNVSKKWNKHNSFLFTAAGLPSSLTQQESNVHFLATSNIAPPLEMLDGIVDQLESCQTNGIWAWDVVEKEMVLVIPAVLALLGDNPMQSEFACHIGLRGKFFCRNCWVKGNDAAEVKVSSRGEGYDLSGGSGNDSDVETQSRRSNGSEKSDAGSTSQQDGEKQEKGKSRKNETMQELVDRARRFLGNNASRNKHETIQKLESMFLSASTIGGKRRYKAMKTSNGLKDTFMEFFKQASLTAKIERDIPKDHFSPVWRIKGLDPHKDTPVEILHVILLGFIKYFWRDVMSVLKQDQKDLLVTRLNSFDISGLKLSPLPGSTLVQYAGSLVGRDFRAISQVAPFVLYDLVTIECYETWLAISTLVPLIWQSTIIDLDQHVKALESAIDYFLNCTARWTPRWFNKPKFHIIQHLPPHVRRFGPAPLFATEAFESFNAVIRSQSVHSNRQAPSRDIGRGLAQCNRTRHLLSGGHFMPCSQAERKAFSQSRTQPFSDNEKDWHTAGPRALALAKPGVTIHNLLADVLGLYQATAPCPGEYNFF
ncbi:hypothetical protein C8Q75DRAFT_795782 [Abortiporus biennis]|nr:hypothetical protein C8Q75DRAFT_795782 [Abortiporus biennis]